MQAAAKTYLHFVSFTGLVNWSVQYMLDTSFSYADKYDLAEIGTFLNRNKTPIDIEDSKEYKRVTIKINNGGVFLRDIKKGANIGTKKQFIVSEGQFLLSKIDARNGAFGVIPKEVDGAIITGNFWTFDVDYSKINPHFLSLITTTPEFIKFSENASNGTTNRHYLQENLFLAQKIPLPSLLEQTRIVENYNAKLRQAEMQEQQAKALEAGIEKYLFEVLGIEKGKGEVFSKGKLYFAHFKNIQQWGAEKLLESQNNSLLNSSKYENVNLSNSVFINPRTELSSDEMSFIPMECVSDTYGEIIELRNGTKKGSSGYTKFQENDLIWARITPCMQNGKSTVVKNLKNGLGYGSTEYHVFRSKKDDILIDYLYMLLRTNSIRHDAVRHFTGSAGQQRVPKSYFENLQIPSPPLSVQEEIVNHIQTIKEQIKMLRQNAEENKKNAIKEFEKEIFNQ